MPKLACRCGYVMNLSNGTPDFELALVPENMIEYIGENLENPGKIDIDKFFDLIDEVKTTVYKCPSCGRLHVDSGKGIFISFAPEPGLEIKA